jgi:Holliday junction resolvase
LQSKINSSYAERKAQSRYAGTLSEKRFVDAMYLQGHLVIKGSQAQDIHDHVDFIVTTKDKTFTVDVKRSEGSETIWIEIKNVQGKLGWLYGKADCIAFDSTILFKILMVDREELKEYIHKNTTKEFKPKEHALHHLYQRAGRRDVLTLIPLADLFTFTSLQIIRHEPKPKP